MAYQVLIIDDEEIVCRGMAQFIKWQEHGFSVAGTVYLAKEGLKFLENHHVDVIFLDIRMPEMTGLEMLKIISAKYPSIKTVILVDYKSNVCAANPQIFSVKVLLSCFGPDRMIGRVPSCVCCRFRSAASGRIKRMSPALFDDGRSVRHPANADR